jgi:nucleoside-diphosphate-sugar epimerase
VTVAVLVLGATGQIGPDLLDRLKQAGLRSIGVGRNPVRLELLSRAGHTAISIGLDGPSALRELPEADWLVDLTYATGRLPRTILERADRQAALLRSYADAHPASQVLQIGTFAVAGYKESAPPNPVTRLTWEDTYLLAKSAAEIALTRRNQDGRLRILRLGNVVTPESQWGTLLLRTLLAGTGSRASLSEPANLCTNAAILTAMRSDAPQISFAAQVAGFSWLEVLEAVLAAIPSSHRPGFAPSGGDDLTVVVSPRRSRSEILLRLLSLVPPQLENGRPWEKTGLAWLARVLSPLRDQRVAATLPPIIPKQGLMPGGVRDLDALQQMASELALAYTSRGYD